MWDKTKKGSYRISHEIYNERPLTNNGDAHQYIKYKVGHGARKHDYFSGTVFVSIVCVGGGWTVNISPIQEVWAGKLFLNSAL